MDNQNLKTAAHSVTSEQQKIEEFKDILASFNPADLVKSEIDPPSLRKNVMDQIVNLIKFKVSHDEMTDQRAKDIADYVLEKMPSNISYEHLMTTLPKLDDQFQELADVVMPIMTEYEKRVKEEVEKLINRLIADGRLDDARKVIQTTIDFEKGLS